ncbi:MAG: hypothetical protein Q8K98_02280 [Bacteroidota bacterium]|nr:hypothetical protein [Bacteroidota bacterium]
MKKLVYLLWVLFLSYSSYSQSKLSTHSITVNPGWNLLSLPANVADSLKSSLFPNAASSAFIYDNGYYAKDTLQHGYGFWMKFNSQETIPVTGNILFEDTIAVKSGWNIIGSLSMPIAANAIITDPPGIMSSNFYGFENGYKIVDTIQPGLGYWVKVNQNGSIILPSDSVKIITLTDGTILPELDSNIVSISPDSNSVTLTYSSPDVVPQFNVGDIIVGTTGDGYLRKVVSVEYQGNSVLLTTTDASFDEALVTGIADTSFFLLPPEGLEFSKISYSDKIMTKKGLQHITVSSDQPSVSRLLKINSFQIKIPNLSLRIGVPINEAGPYLSVGIDTIKLTLSFRPQIYLNFRTGNFKLLVQKGLKTELITDVTQI